MNEFERLKLDQQMARAEAARKAMTEYALTEKDLLRAILKKLTRVVDLLERST